MLKHATRQVHTDLAMFKGIAEMMKESERNLVGVANKCGELRQLVEEDRPEGLSPDALGRWDFKDALKEGYHFTLARDMDSA